MSAPLIYGSQAAAYRVKSGDCRMLMTGHSMVNPGASGFWQQLFKIWRPDRWVGVGCQWGGSTGDPGDMVSLSHYSPTFAATAESDAAASGVYPTPGSNANVAGVGTTWNRTFGQYTVFNGGAVPADPNPFGNRVAEAQLSSYANANVFNKVKWADGKPMTARYIYVANTSGCTSFRVRIRDTGGSNILGETVGCSAGGPLRINFVDATAASANHSTNGLVLSIQPTASTTPANGLNLVHSGVRFFTGETGFEIHFLNHGSYSTNDFLDTTKMSDALFKNYLTALAPTDIFYYIGQNDPGSNNKAAFKANIQAYIDLCRTTLPTVHFWLQSPHQTLPASWSQTSNSAQDYADAMYEIALSDGNTSFLNTGLAIGGGFDDNAYNLLKDNFLVNESGNFIHPSGPNGHTLIAATDWGMIETMARSTGGQGTVSIGGGFSF